ncbi:aminopeptidase [Vulcanimicrobium alpinum]|uniref:Aminopeptidase n=1 Tax=Vulcanimicrobium alpinum TaxID=3016050 RepID=A0AAN1XXR0_UNVUL|nr:M20/M25/M40 family metallo-hydrolase [Vulcanimicrobium alpinum]BDE07336.1 aminopeptidase [Vulcanimicrobium alpinum]
MPLRRLLAASVAALALTAPARADVPAPPLDPAIVAALAAVSPAELRATDAGLVAFGTRSTFSEQAGSKRGVFAARAYLVQRFRRIAAATNGRMTVALDTYTQPADPKKRIPRQVVISSVVATLRGDDPSGRTYVMSSHYDSRNSNNDDGEHDAPGADDNGSGTAAVVEAARVLANVPLHATVVFACFDAEEQGLFGSAHYAKTLKDAHVDVQGDINNDIIGASVGDDGIKRDNVVRIFSEALPPGTDPARINVVGGENDSPSRELARFAKETGDAYPTGLHGLIVYRADRFLRGGDHESFNAEGFPAIRYVEPVETFAHQHQDVRVEAGVQYGDLLQYEDFDYLARVTRYNIATVASLALAPAPPKATIETKVLTNDTTLTWTAVPRAVRYEIVRRATSDALWTDVQDAGNAATATLKFSKDNWLFGVRSVDAQGHRSVAAYPAPVR